MSYPYWRLTWKRLGTGVNPSAHVVLRDLDGMPIGCGRIPLEWLTSVPIEGSEADIVMCRVHECDHGPNHSAVTP